MSTHMFREAAEAASVVHTQLARNAAQMQALGAALRNSPPRIVVTCARGSSKNAATYARYLIGRRVQLLTSPLAPSIGSVYGVASDMQGVLFLAISQSGRSPDLIACAELARSRGAIVVALCNAEDAPLARIAHHFIALHAGLELSVAATKSYVASLSAVGHLVAEWTADSDLRAALLKAPDHIERAWMLDWGEAFSTLEHASSLFVVGRGPGLSVAQEAALKLKETCGLHAEALSAAEVMHGPMALVREGFPALMFAQSDETRPGVEQLAANFAARGAKVLLSGARATGVASLASLQEHPAIEPMLAVTSFYRMTNALAQARGFDPDAPPHLRKVTETL